MIRNSLGRLSSYKITKVCGPYIYNSWRLFSKHDKGPSEMHFNDQQASYYTAKDVEFCPNRAKDVMQNSVQEASQVCNGDSDTEIKTDSATDNDKDHIDSYQHGSNVSLHSVMQSNVPEPFTTKGKSPTHLNMPGSSSSQDCKYLSGKMQSTHQSEQ